MAKFYAVRKPAPARVFTDWASCEAVVKGAKGAEFRSFGDRLQAEEWAGMATAASPDGNQAYVDGSFISGIPEAGWAVVVVRDGKEIHRESGRTPLPARSRNIDGEVHAAWAAIEWLSTHGGGTVCHDYEGIARWALGEWKAESEVAREYQRRIGGKLNGIQFRKVAAHTGEAWNELVDSLARGALAR